MNAFGFAGINAHAVLEEHAASADGACSGVMLDWDSEAFLLAADGRSELVDRVRWLRDRLTCRGDLALKDLAFTLNTESSSSSGPARLGLVAGSVPELIAQLELIEPRLRAPSCRQVRDARGLYYWDEPVGRQGRLAFLFPGEGTQYPGMLADLCPHFPELRGVLDMADRIARESGETVPPSHHLFGGPSANREALWATDTAVTAVLSAQWAIYQVLSRLGLRPDAVAGHSSGELPALAAAGVLETEQVLERQLIRLAAIFRELETHGKIPTAKLVAAGTNRGRAEVACLAGGASVTVAIDNCPHQVVIAGDPGEVDHAVALLRSEGVVCEELPFARAYHTPAFAAVTGPLSSFYASLDFRPSRVPVYSCALAARMTNSADEMRRLAVAQWTRRVDFRSTIESMHRDGLRVFVDVGTRGNLCGYVDDILRGRPAFAVAANLPRRSGTAQLNHLVASLFAQGLALDPSYIYGRRRPERVDLDAPPAPARAVPSLALGFPELRLSEGAIERLRERSRPVPDRDHDAANPPEDVNAGAGLPAYNGRLGHALADLNGHDGRSAQGYYHKHTALNGHHVNGNGAAVHHDAWFDPKNGVAAVAQAPTLPDAVVADSVPAADAAMLAFLRTMNEFLATQREVMQAFLPGGGTDAHLRQGGMPQPGPWVGAVEHWEPGQAIVSRLSLDPLGNPVAENHTLGGRRVSALDPVRKGLPVVPFFVMAEMAAQSAACIVPPGLALESLGDVCAHRWVPYSSNGVLEIRGQCDPADSRQVRVTLRHVLGENASEPEAARLVFEAVARFSERAGEPAQAAPFELPDSRASKFTAARLYSEQWLFHGEPMQALVELGQVSPQGISGTLEVLPLDPLLRPGELPAWQTDPVVLDTFTHLLGCWGLDCLDQGDVVFPLRMGRLAILGEAPEAGARVECQVRVRAVERHRVLVDADLVRADGRAWMQLRDWEDWRFYWPARYRDVFRAPDTVLIGEALPLDGVDPDVAAAVWLEPPADMGRPIWRDVLEQVQLAPQELAESLGLHGSELRRSHWLWGRIAAKEAVRRLWLRTGGVPRFPADLAIRAGAIGSNGRPRITDLADPGRDDLPAISIAHAEGVVVALAAVTGRSAAGIDVAAVDDRAAGNDPLVLEEDERLVAAPLSGPARRVAGPVSRSTSSRGEGLWDRAWCGKPPVRGRACRP